MTNYTLHNCSIFTTRRESSTTATVAFRYPTACRRQHHAQNSAISFQALKLSVITTTVPNSIHVCRTTDFIVHSRPSHALQVCQLPAWRHTGDGQSHRCVKWAPQVRLSRLLPSLGLWATGPVRASEVNMERVDCTTAIVSCRANVPVADPEGGEGGGRPPPTWV